MSHSPVDPGNADNRSSNEQTARIYQDLALGILAAFLLRQGWLHFPNAMCDVVTDATLQQCFFNIFKEKLEDEKERLKHG